MDLGKPFLFCFSFRTYPRHVFHASPHLTGCMKPS